MDNYLDLKKEIDMLKYELDSLKKENNKTNNTNTDIMKNAITVSENIDYLNKTIIILINAIKKMQENDIKLEPAVSTKNLN